MLWAAMSKVGCSKIFLGMMKVFHEGMQARVLSCGEISDPFLVGVAEKQGCVQASVV